MPKKRPPKVSFKVNVSETLMERFDKAVVEEGYDGRSELVVRLMRDFLEERDKQNSVNLQYLILKEKKSIDHRKNKMDEDD